ncbi:MAG TPA: hypothetical protein VKK79_00735 [Candidatus Lokiarchaeia archaeon]|nr:hypothetical protein [Candidatus Lokiarchaeia archaeon]
MATSSPSNETIPNVVCTGCALLCDDIFVEMEDGSFKQGVNACNRGWKKFQYYLNELVPLNCQQRPGKQGGDVVTYDDALAGAVSILQEAKSPLVYGFASSSLEDQQAIFELAEKVGAQLGGPAFQTLIPFYTQAINALLYTGTLAEAINKADVFVFWNADPLESHPRLLSKVIYSRGFFRITGYEVKKYIVIHPSDPDKFRGTTLGVKVPPEIEQELINALRASIVAGAPADAPAGVDKAAFEKLASLLIDAEYAIFFLDKSTLRSDSSSPLLTDLAGLVADLNQKERAMLLPLAEDLNSMGLFLHSLATGRFPLAEVDWEHVDAIMVGGVEETTELPPQLLSAGKSVPLIFLPQEEMILAKSADIIIPVAAPGITDGGTAARFDGVAVPLKKVAEPKNAAPTTLQVITDIIARLSA